MERMTAADAQTYWMSAKIPNDQFLLFCFAHVLDTPQQIAVHVRRRASSIDDLGLRVREVPGTLDYPYWVPAMVSDDQIRVHRPMAGWTDALDTLAELMADQLDPRVHAWRVHLLGPVTDAPGAAGVSSVIAVLQVVHALADGDRASAIARQLFDNGPLPAGEAGTARGGRSSRWVAAATGVTRFPVQLATLMVRAHQARLAHGELIRDIDAGVIDEPKPGSPRAAVNVDPGGRRALRVVLVDADRLRAIGGSVTVGALVVVGDALAAQWAVPPGRDLRAELTVAKSGPRRSRNHFRNAGVTLFTAESDPHRRAEYIRAEIAQIRARTDHRLTGAESAATAQFPAALTQWGTHSFDTTIVPDLVTGNTVVSSVNRGAADLSLGGGTVCFTAGFPALSPVQSLTHGVHGIGGTVAISIVASPDVVTDLDGYTDRIREAVTPRT